MSPDEPRPTEPRVAADALEMQIRRTIAEFAKIDPLALQADADLFAELGIDSLEGLKLLATLEAKYHIRIPDHQLMQLNTLERVVGFVAAQQDAAGLRSAPDPR